MPGVILSDTDSLCDYNSVAALKADRLKRLCKFHHIDTQLPKKARIILLCHILGISTTGQKVTLSNRNVEGLTDAAKQELPCMTPAYICQLQEWRKTLAGLPDIEESDVKKYLINTAVLTASDARTYKITRPYALQQFVHTILLNDHPESFLIVRALCNPSQSTNHDEVKLVFVIIDRHFGTPYGGYCTCTVGTSERCGHIGAVLFKLAQLQATGALEGPSCTDVLCPWADPKGSKSEPTKFQDLKIRKNNSPSIRRTEDDYGNKITNQSPPSYDEVAELRANLIAATHHIGQYCPAIHVLNFERFKSKNSQPVEPNICSSLPETLTFHCEQLAPAHDEEVVTTPLTIPQLVTKRFLSNNEKGFSEASEIILTNATSMNIDVEEVERVTRGQAENSQWLDQRSGAITATKFAASIKVREKNKTCDSLVKDIVCIDKTDKLKNVPAIKWGRKNEGKARQAYFNKYEKNHKDFKVEECGLFVYKECNYIRGSPDGLITCQCHGKTLLEIKCPFSAKQFTVEEAVANGKIRFLEKLNRKFKLKMNSPDGYFAQVQGLMGITGTKMCHFVVWTTCDFVTVEVEFDTQYFLGNLVPSCKHVFKDHVIPKLLIEDSKKATAGSNNETAIKPFKAVLKLQANHDTTDHPSKRTKSEEHVKVKTPPKQRVLSKIVLPSTSVQVSKQSTSAELILAETKPMYKCVVCKKELPDDHVAEDNSNASVGCDCKNCGGCDVWMCWPCARYDQDWADSGDNWYCPECTRECDIIY